MIPEVEEHNEDHQDTEGNVDSGWYQSASDPFGIFRRYPVKPARDPDNEEYADDLVDNDNIASAQKSRAAIFRDPLRSFTSNLRKARRKARNWFAPFRNPTVFRILHWAYTDSKMLSQEKTDRLVHEVILAPDFEREDLRGFSMSKEEKRLDRNSMSEEGLLSDGWIKATVRIPLPMEKARYASEADAPHMNVPGVLHRKIIPVIRSVCEDKSARCYNFIPYKLFFRDDNGKIERIYCEVYNSDAMLKEDAKIRAKARDPTDGPEVEYAVFPIIPYSDGTRLANFGTASLWPLYFYFPALSKYVRNKGDSFAAHHMAYLPSVRPQYLDYSTMLT